MASVTSMLMVSIQVKKPGLGLEFSIRKRLCRSMQIISLWTELGCNSELSASVRSSQRIKGVIVDNNGEGEQSGSRVRSRVRIMCSTRSTSEIRLQLEFGSASDVRVSARISLRFKVK